MKRTVLIRLFVLVLFLQHFMAGKATGQAWKDTVSFSLRQRPKVFVNLTTFNSFISGDFANFFGFRLGIQYNKKIKFGTGFFSLNPNAVVSRITVMEDTVVNETNAELHSRFFSLTAEYIFYQRHPWQFSVFPLDLGIGGAHYRYISRLEGNRKLQTPDVAIIFYQPAVTAQYNIFKWLGVGVSAGYRFPLYSSEQVKEDFSAPAFSVGIRLFIDEAYRSLFPNGLRINGSKDDVGESPIQIEN